ncbi:hypothetical protein UFOVP1077_12 [uncultured Caudovirales phage]|uniref:Uncharacterized protein n=1 Tax=uncultured Caudovirales phage TaxID=2100421 RepID=A0A6J7XEA4_9CAUD|nr:hypothetical protein UFOVP1077_12 [uncultured Caudovirales phage]CAB4198184.1 hypothetical protein UFOVP1316_55 [uncultured Caudovirales phage]CAB4211339.1 hypothetical protein UFOVP1428_9 [uncultured Caudovirales phage]CAB5227370.1 hypothetical protein UFOVP1526_35 [uncultured Caudovirales phage]
MSKEATGLSEEQLEALVTIVSEKVVENFYAEIGKNVVRKFLWIAGIIGFGIAMMLGFTGKLPQP